MLNTVSCSNLCYGHGEVKLLYMLDDAPENMYPALFYNWNAHFKLTSKSWRHDFGEMYIEKE